MGLEALEWRWASNTKMYAMRRVNLPNTRSMLGKRLVGGTPSTWAVFGRVEADATGQLVASATEFEHIKYVASFEEGRQHIEAIYALEDL